MSCDISKRKTLAEARNQNNETINDNFMKRLKFQQVHDNNAAHMCIRRSNDVLLVFIVVLISCLRGGFIGVFS